MCVVLCVQGVPGCKVIGMKKQSRRREGVRGTD
jgi:hypothetical protein